MSPTEIWLRLMAVYSLSGEIMVQAFQRLQNRREDPADALRLVGLNAKQRTLFFSYPAAKLDAVLRWLEIPGHHLLTALSPAYPLPLRAIEWFPGALLVAGDPTVLTRPQLAVVGSRHHSWYGEHWGSKLCYALAEVGLTLTSGLALGIDAVAHRSALRAQGKTIAVLGNGLAQVYPARHRKLAEEIIAQGGAVISEFPFEAQPRPANFPRRNRIISGLSFGVLVVEAALRSGSLVTARCALEQGREVFALPGPIGNPGCEGPHWLIQQGAIAVTHPQDIIDYLQNELPWLNAANYSPDQEEGALPFPELLANVGDEVTPVDVVAERAGQPVPMTVAQLLELELAGWIAAVPGGYVRVRRAGHVRRTNVFV
ncbi:DNA-protecting protein DprA [Cronobacter dublinensis]|uniref:DNA-protecting protein DprA n=1 Tax=Cronobacter dublinensis TaxID=413497 RepID=UPI001375E27C|nr:DNA-protecting protein DprA [Cronobacter dublinensis]NCH61178.1 DNA-protecting protein DprA [Cronobacter dublinensis]